MWHLLTRRLVASLPTLLGVSFIAFALIRLVPGDPVTIMLGERGGSPEVIEELKAKMGLDQSLPKQYGLFLWRAVRGDLGESIISKRSVWEEFMDRFPATVELSAAALLFGVVFGIPLGLLAAAKRGSIWDRLSTVGSLVGYSMPIFWWGLILILLFSVRLGWTPVAGRMGVAYDIPVRSGFLLVDVWFAEDSWAAFREALRHLILPAVALGTIPLAAIARMTRATMIEVLREDYIRTARAKGLGVWRVVAVHGLRNALIPVVTVIGLMGSSLLTGAILTETIFAWPGIGKWLVTSVTSRDYPVIQGGLLLICLTVIAVNLLVDMLYLWINPMVRAHHE